MLNGLNDYLKNNIIPNNNPNSYMNVYSALQKVINNNEKIIPLLIEYHNETIQDFIIYCYKKLKEEIKNMDIIDLFIKYTDKINFLIYWLTRIFNYLDRINNREKDNKNLLCNSAMEEYKNIFFKKYENKIYKEVNKLIKEDRKNNTEYRPKITKILKTINNLDLIYPKISKEANNIIWIEDENVENETSDYIYGKKWFNYFKDETINFAKDKANNDIHHMSAHEYILSSLEYINKEKERQKEYINPFFYEAINNINYKYFIGNNTTELMKKETGIKYMFNNKLEDELKLAYDLIDLYPDCLDPYYQPNKYKDNENNKDKELYINEPKKLITEAFKDYVIKRGSEISNNKEIIKDPKRCIPELINLNNEMNNIIEKCFKNSKIFHNTKYAAFSIFMSKDFYAKQLSNYTDYCMRAGFRGKTDQQVDKMLDDIIQLFKYLNSKLTYHNESDDKMSNRLIKNSSLSINWEKNFISKLKQEAGLTMVNKKNMMIQDLELNKKELLEYKNTTNKGMPSGIKFNVTFISESAWNINQNVIV